MKLKSLNFGMKFRDFLMLDIFTHLIISCNKNIKQKNTEVGLRLCVVKTYYGTA